MMNKLRINQIRLKMTASGSFDRRNIGTMILFLMNMLMFNQTILKLTASESFDRRNIDTMIPLF